MIQADVLDVVLRISNLRRFQAGMAEAAGSVKAVGNAARATNAETAAMGRRTGAIMAMGRAAKWGALGIAAMGVEAYKLTTNFDATMTRVQTMAGAGADEIKALRGQVLALAADSAYGPGELARGLYHLESIGLRGAKAMYALKAASDGAAIGGSELESTTTALGSALRVHIKGAATDARQAMAQLNAIAGSGNMTLQNLVYALGTGILPAAKAAGLSLQNVGGAIALLTDEGYPASSGAAQLGTALHFLYAPTKKATDALDSLGITQADLVGEMNGPEGLMGALGLLEDRLQAFAMGDRAKYLAKLGDILPGGRGRVLILLMNQLENYRQKIKQIGTISGEFEGNLAATHETASYRLHSAWSTIQKDLILFADTWKGPVTDAITFVMNNVIAPLILGLAAIPRGIEKIINWFKGLPEPIKLAATAVGILVAEFIVYRGVAAGIAIANGFLAASYAAVSGAAETAYLAMLIALDNPIVLAIAAVVAALVLLITHWKEVKKAAAETWSWIKHAVTDAANWIWDHAYVLAGVPIVGQVAFVVIEIIKHWKEFKRALASIWHWIKTGPIGDTIGWMYRRIKDIVDLIGKLKDAFTPGGYPEALKKKMKGHASPLSAGLGLLPHNAQGTQNWMGGLSWVGERGPELVNIPRGASVIPTGQSYFEPRRHTPNPTPSGFGQAQIIEHHTTIELDRKVIGRAVNRFSADRKARRDG